MMEFQLINYSNVRNYKIASYYRHDVLGHIDSNYQLQLNQQRILPPSEIPKSTDSLNSNLVSGTDLKKTQIIMFVKKQAVETF